jgi:hypothetical protein
MTPRPNAHQARGSSVEAASEPCEFSARHESTVRGPQVAQWTRVDVAARMLDVSPVTLRRVIERNARCMPDGSTEAKVDGVRARKIGRRWRVWLDPSWTRPAA